MNRREIPMKTRNELYNGEGAELLRFITTYHTLLYEQVLRLFPKNRDSIKSLITNLVKQGRIIHDKENDHTIVSIMDCEAFPGWIKSRQKCIRTISEIS